MNVPRNDDSLTTADIVNAENNRDARQSNSENPQPQQSVATLERERVQGSVENMPDLQDKFDPRTQPARDEQELRKAEFRNEDRTESMRTVENAKLSAPALASGTAVVANPETAKAKDASSASSGPLFPEDELHNFRTQWDHVQASFVDEPRQAVQQADSLVANVVKRIAEQFAEERARLEKQWDRGDDVSTEDLRQGLKRYRAFFDRLLSF